MPRRLRHERTRTLTTAQTLLALLPPMKSKLLRSGLSLAEADAAVKAWRRWDGEHGAVFRHQHGISAKDADREQFATLGGPAELFAVPGPPPPPGFDE